MLQLVRCSTDNMNKNEHPHFSASLCNFVGAVKFTLQKHSSLLSFQHYMFRPNWLPSSVIQVVKETAAPLSHCYSLHFNFATYSAKENPTMDQQSKLLCSQRMYVIQLNVCFSTTNIIRSFALPVTAK
jgi:hypothetical protein